MKSAGRRGNIGPSAGLVFLELTEPADLSVGRFHNLSAINLSSNWLDLLVHRGIHYARPGDLHPKFIMADSEDEFMPICVAASAACVAKHPKHLPARRWTCVSNISDTAGRRRAGIGSTNDARPMPRFLELT